METKGKVKGIVIIGLGQLHPRLYMPIFRGLKELCVVGAYDPDTVLLKGFCEEFQVPALESMDAVLEAGGVDIAAIFMPHDQCLEAARLCAGQGWHLMVEKPMASTVEAAREMVAIAEKQGVLLTTGYCWRYHPVGQEIRRLLRAGVIGRVIAAEGLCAAGRLQRYIDGHSSWMLQKDRSGGGPLFNLGVHWIDLFRFLLEEEVEAVSGVNLKVNDTYDIEDNSFAHLRFKSGALLGLDISYTVPSAFPHGRDLHLSIRGTGGVLSWDPAYEGESDKLFLCSDESSCAGAQNRVIEFQLERRPGYSGYMGHAYVESFLRAIEEKRAPDITGADGVAALEVVDACYRSNEAARWVSVNV